MPIESALVVFDVPSDSAARRRARIAAKVRRWSTLAAKAHPRNTLLAWESDWKTFLEFCGRDGRSVLPAAPETLEAFIADCVEAGKALATIRRYRATIAKAHQVAGVADPTRAETVRLALKAAATVRPARQKQARGLGWEDLERLLALPAASLRACRDRAFIAVAYDTLCRSAELVQFDVSDFILPEQGSGTALVRKSKRDQAGEGAQAFLASSTVRIVREWLERSGIQEGAVFRHIVGKHRLGERLRPPAAGEIFRRLMLRAGGPAEAYRGTSGHSTRVGGIQDLLALNAELPAIERDARLNDPRMVIRYGERILAARGAMARAAKAQGRL